MMMEVQAQAEFIEVKSPIDRFREEWAKVPGSMALFRQRSFLLQSPELLQYAEMARPQRWIQPLAFALQGLLLGALFLSGLSWLITRDEGTYADEIAKVQAELNSQLKTQQELIDASEWEIKRIESSRKTSGFTVATSGNLTKDEALQQLNALIEEDKKLQEDYKLRAAIKTQNLRAAADGFALAASGTPVIFCLALIFAAPLFGQFMRREYARSRLAAQADSFYLYYLTGAGLWLSLIFVVVLNLFLSGSSYGLGGLIEGVGPVGRLLLWLALYALLVYWFLNASRGLQKAMQLPRLNNYLALENKALLHMHNSFWIVFITFETVLGLLAYAVYLLEKTR